MRAAIVACFAALLAACQSVPVPTEQAAVVPPERVLQKSLASPAPDRAQVTVKRDAHFVGSGCFVQLFVNGDAAALIEPRERLDLFLPLGDHVLSVRYAGAALCGTHQYVAEAGVNVKPGVPRLFRISQDVTGPLLIQPSAF